MVHRGVSPAVKARPLMYGGAMQFRMHLRVIKRPIGILVPGIM